MPTLPDVLDRDTHVDLHGRNVEPIVRAAGLALFLGLVVAGLVNVFGQRPVEKVAESPAARLTLRAPSGLRSGLYFQALFRVDAHRELERAALVLDPGWFEGVTSNSVQPEALEWTQREGRNVLVFGPVEAGERLVVRVQFQVNPTTAGRRSAGVVLEDRGRPLVRIDHDQTVFP